MSLRNQILWTALGCSAVLSQPAAAAEPIAPMRVVQVGEVQYISGGTTRAERRELEARTPDFRLQVSFLAKQPERVVVKLKRRDEAGKPLDLTAAGPLMLVNMPSGRYTLTAILNGELAVESQFELEPGEFEKLDIQLDDRAH